MHDRSAPVGVIEAIRIVNGRLEGVARFGNNRVAQEVLADVLAGTLSNMSIGYLVHESRAEPGGVVRATRWEPYEASLVSIPADPTVGINRSFQEVPIVDTPNTPAQAEASGTDTAQAEAVRKAERNRIANIRAAGKFGKMREVDIERAIDSGVPADVFQRRAFEHLGAVTDNTPIRHGAHDHPGLFSLGRRNDQRTAAFSIGRAVAAAITGDWSQAGVEREVSREIAHRFGRKPEGIFVPSFALAKRDLLTSTSSGAMLGTEHAGDAFIGDLKAEVSVMNLGATVLHGLSKDVSIPRMTAGTSAYLGRRGQRPGQFRADLRHRAARLQAAVRHGAVQPQDGHPGRSRLRGAGARRHPAGNRDRARPRGDRRHGSGATPRPAS